MYRRLVSLSFTLLVGACSSGGYHPLDGAVSPRDLAGILVGDLASRGDLREAADGESGGCITSLMCDARTAPHDCGVTTATGQRYPDLGAPYCTDETMRVGCSCDLVRCVSSMPFCPGTYQAVFTERLILGCDGVANVLGGTCPALWNTVQTSPGAVVLSDRQMLNVYLDWASADYQQAFNLTEQTVIEATVQQDCWFADVSGNGDAGRSEVSKISITKQ